MVITVKNEISDFYELEQMCWSGAISVINEIKRQGKENECMSLLEDIFYDGATDTEINDFIWFDIESSDFLNLYPEDEEEEEEE